MATFSDDARQDFCLQDRLIRTRERLVVVDGASTKLEPRVMGVLLELSRQHGQVVTRDALLDALWPEDAGSDEALSRCVYLLRKALGDERDAPAFIETVPKTGYRLLIAPSAVPPGPANLLPVPEAKRARWWVWVPLGIVGIGGLASLYGSLDAPPRLDVPEVFVKPIEAEGTDPDLSMLALGLGEGIRVATLNHDGLNVSFKAVPLDAPDPIQRPGQYLFHGRLQPNPGESTALLTLFIDSRSGSGTVTSPLNLFEVPQVRSQDDLEAFHAHRSAIIQRVMGYLAEQLPVVNAMNDLQIEAFRLLMFADWELYTGKNCGLGALSLLERSLDLEPGFSRTWGQLGEAHWQQVWECGQSGDHATRALEALDRARQIDPEDPYGVYLQAIILSSMGQAEDAYAFLQPHLERTPAEVYYLQAAAHVLTYAGFLEDAAALHQSMHDNDPLALSADMLDLRMSLLYLNQYAAFLDAAPTKPAPYLYFFRAWGHLQAGETARAQDLLLRLKDLGSPGLFSRYGQVLLTYLNGRTQDALDELRAIARGQASHAVTTGEAQFTRAQLFALLGDGAGARSSVRAALAAGFFCPPCYQRNDTLRPYVEDPEMTDELQAARERHQGFATRFGLNPQPGG